MGRTKGTCVEEGQKNRRETEERRSSASAQMGRNTSWMLLSIVSI